ncbi:MAG: FtsL-like putative cell division protein [Flammeovirgaceae bacterium]|nr:FtsL-like putative cell division protein [Flammeovirgaceae bacterium]
MNQNRLKNQEQKKKSFLHWLIHRTIELDENVVVKYLPHMIYATFLGILYIANTYYTEKIIAQTIEIQQELDSVKVDYSTLKYEFVYASKPAEIAEKVKQLGLIENEEPVYRIEVEEDFFEEE